MTKLSPTQQRIISEATKNPANCITECSLQSLAHKAGRLKGTAEELSADIEAISDQVESYKTWVKEIGKDRSVKHVLVVKPTSKTAQLIAALDDDAHMTRAPIHLTNPIGNGSDVVLLFPTAKLLQAVGGVQTLADHPIRPEDIIPEMRAKLNPEAKIDGPSIAPRTKTAKEVITREAKAAFTALRPKLVYERQEHSYTDHQAAKPIGEQAVLVFDIAGKRDLAQLKKLAKTLDENDLTLKHQHYGELSDDSEFLSPEEQKAKALIDVAGRLESVKAFIQDFSSEFNELHYSSEQTQARIEAKKAKLQAQLDACKEAVTTLTEAGISLEQNPVNMIEAFSAALAEPSRTHQTLYNGASAATRTLNLSKMNCDDALEAFEDVAESASKPKVSVKTHADCIFAGDVGIDLGQIDTQLGMLGDKRQLVIP
jgi:methyl-accepting chemotaxis protein